MLKRQHSQWVSYYRKHRGNPKVAVFSENEKRVHRLILTLFIYCVRFTPARGQLSIRQQWLRWRRHATFFSYAQQRDQLKAQEPRTPSHFRKHPYISAHLQVRGSFLVTDERPPQLLSDCRPVFFVAKSSKIKSEGCNNLLCNRVPVPLSIS